MGSPDEAAAATPPALAAVTDNDGKDDAGLVFVTALLGWGIAGLLLVVLIWGTGRVDTDGARALEVIVRREAGTLWWHDDAGGSSILGLLAFLMPVVVVLAFGGLQRFHHQQFSWLRAWPAPARWTVVAVAVLATAATIASMAGRDERNGGFATAEGAGWIKRGVVFDRQPWTAAVRLDAGCVMIARENGRTIKRTTWHPSSDYQVAFPNGRTAPLLRRRPDTVWLDAVAPVDAALRAADVPRVGDVEDRCILEELPDRLRDRERFKALLTP